MLYLMGDFETTTDINDCRVWASCLVNIEDNKVVHLSNNIEDTFNFLKDLLKYTSITIYYHNLKFDGEFWLSYLMNNDFTYSDKLNVKNSFNTLITDTGAFYQLQFKLGKGKNANKVTMLDSLKVLPLKVEVLAKSFNLPMLKGSIDYKAYRPVGHTITEEEKEYIINDCKIVASCLKLNFEQGLTKMTIASNAINSYKDLIGRENFRRRFPELEKEDDKNIRNSYKGGFTYVNEKFKNKDIKKIGCTYDVNSLYPSVMYNEVLPYDKPIKFDGEYQYNENYPLYIQCIECKFKIKKGFIPIMQIKNNSRFGETEYLKESGPLHVKLWLTSVDLELFKKHYNVYGETYLGGYMFKGQKDMFKEYIDHWKHIKETSTGGLRQLAKLMLNSLYGKFAQSPNGVIKIPKTDENGVTYLEEVEGEERETVYTAMASFITAYARKVTITAFQENVNRCCYADTDSIHLIGDEVPNIKVDDNIIGYWKKECVWQYAKFIRAKTYIEEVDGKLEVKCAGMPQNLKDHVTKKNFKSGLTLGGKLVPKRCKGGVVLVETDFTIK